MSQKRLTSKTFELEGKAYIPLWLGTVFSEQELESSYLYLTFPDDTHAVYRILGAKSHHGSKQKLEVCFTYTDYDHLLMMYEAAAYRMPKVGTIIMSGNYDEGPYYDFIGDTYEMKRILDSFKPKDVGLAIEALTAEVDEVLL